jgi:fumarylacetoacetase
MSTPALDKLPFTLQCLPYGIISTADSEPRCAVAIGDHAIDLLEYAHSGRLAIVSEAFGDVEFDHVFGQVSLTCNSTTTMSRRVNRTGNSIL